MRQPCHLKHVSSVIQQKGKTLKTLHTLASEQTSKTSQPSSTEGTQKTLETEEASLFKSLLKKDAERFGNPCVMSKQTLAYLRGVGLMGMPKKEHRPPDSGALLGDSGFSGLVLSVLSDESFDSSRIPEKALNWLSSYQGKKTPSLWVSGGSGSGKTTLACWLVKALIESSVKNGEMAPSATFVSVADLVRDTWMGSSYYGEDNKWRSIRPLTTCDLLVLDDLGTCVKQGKEECAVVREVVDKRYTSMLPTIFTTQFGLREYCAMLRRAGADEHDVTSLINRILASMSGYLRQDASSIEANHIAV